MYDVYTQRFDEPNIAGRMDAQYTALSAALRNPFGVGYTHFLDVTGGLSSSLSTTTSDSVYVDTLLSSGFLGLSCLLGLIVTCWQHVGASENREVSRILRTGLIAMCAFGTASNAPSSVFVAPVFFFMVGCVASTRFSRSRSLQPRHWNSATRPL